MTDLLTTRQVQEILKVDRITIYRMLQDGRLKGLKVGSQWRFLRQEVDRLLNSADPHQVVSPESSNGFPVHCVQTIQNLLSGVSQMTGLVLDNDGEPVTQFSEQTELSRLVLNSPAGLTACKNAWKNFTGNGSGKGDAFYCPAGLSSAAAPIHDRGQVVGWVLVGQVYRGESASSNAFSSGPALAAVYGLEPKATLSAIKEVPVVTPDQWKTMAIWAEKAAQAIESILRERTGFMLRLQKIADLSQIG